MGLLSRCEIGCSSIQWGHCGFCLVGLKKTMHVVQFLCHTNIGMGLALVIACGTEQRVWIVDMGARVIKWQRIQLRLLLVWQAGRCGIGVWHYFFGWRGARQCGGGVGPRTSCLSVCLYVCLSVYLSVRPSVCLF